MTDSDYGILSTRHFKGHVVSPGHADYDSRRELFNAQYDKKPALIAMCRGTSDVQAAVRYAREHGLEVAVRCGGRHMAGFAGTDGGLVIDLSEMNAVKVDQASRTAWIQGGLTGGGLHPETAAYGLGGVSGMLSHVGVGGALLHGGIGYMSGQLGFGADTLVAAEVVLADGSVLQVSDDAHPDLMWALRGAGSNFGVVTWMKIRLAPIPERGWSGYSFHHGDDAAEVLRLLRDLDPEISDAAQWYADMFFCPADPSMPEELHNQPTLILSLGHLGEEAVADRDVKRFGSLGRPVATSFEQTTFVELNGADDGMFARARQWWDDVRLPELSDKAIDLFVENSHSMFDAGIVGFDYNSFYPLRGAMGRPSELAGCAPRDGKWSVGPMMFWDDSADDAKHKEWCDASMQSYRDAGVTTGSSYFNCVQVPDVDRLRRSYGEDTWTRLVELKGTYDPENFFHLNHNIPPKTD